MNAIEYKRRQAEGIAKAKAAGIYRGRKPGARAYKWRLACSPGKKASNREYVRRQQKAYKIVLKLIELGIMPVNALD